MVLNILIENLKRKSVFLFFILTISTFKLYSQPAIQELKYMLGECPGAIQYSAKQDGLVIYKHPNLNSQKITLTYQNNWLIPYHNVRTRILGYGELEVIKAEKLNDCSRSTSDDNNHLIIGEKVIYLYYQGEGSGRIIVRGAECTVDVHPKLKVFKTLKHPIIQEWIKIDYADGTSPGWLFSDGTQTAFYYPGC